MLTCKLTSCGIAAHRWPPRLLKPTLLRHCRYHKAGELIQHSLACLQCDSDCSLSVSLSLCASSVIMRQCLPVHKPPSMKRTIVEDLSINVVVEVAEKAHDDDSVLLTIRGQTLPLQAVERSPVLQELQDAPGCTALPFSEAAFWSWVDQASADAQSIPLRTCCTNIEVRAMLSVGTVMCQIMLMPNRLLCSSPMRGTNMQQS